METRSGLIAYATETGNAFDYAEELGHLLDRLHFCTHVAELDALDTASHVEACSKHLDWWSFFRDH